MAAAAIAGAALGVGSSLAGPLLQNYQQNKERRWQESMWNRENEYNTPANQVRRLRQAGLNPALATSSGNFQAGLAGHVSGTSTPSYDFSPAGNAVMNSIQLAMQKKKNDAEVSNIDSNTVAQNQRNVFGLYRQLVEIDEILSKKNLNDSQRNYFLSQRNFVQKQVDAYEKNNAADINLKNQQANLAAAQAAKANMESQYQEIINSFAPKQQVQLLKNLRAQEGEIMASAYAHNEQGAYNAALEALTKSQKKGVDIDNQYKKKTAKAIARRAMIEADNAIDENQRQWLRLNYDMQGKAGTWIPNVVGQYETSKGFYGTRHRIYSYDVDDE